MPPRRRKPRARSIPYQTLPHYDVGEAPPSREERQRVWEEALKLRRGALAPEVVAVAARQRDEQVRRLVDEAMKTSTVREA